MEQQPLLSLLKIYFQNQPNTTLMDIIKNFLYDKNIENLTDIDLEKYVREKLMLMCGD
jgi:hypothetical protein